MKLTFLGSGSAFTTGANNFHSNMIIEKNQKRLLIDCGSDARFSLNELGLTHRDIDGVYLSHLHADHVGGLEWLAFTTKFASTTGFKPNLFIDEVLVEPLWENVLSGGLSSLDQTGVDLSTYFTVQPVIDNKRQFKWEGIDFQLIKTLHCMTGSGPMPSYGLMFNDCGVRILISGDTQFRPDEMMKYYKEADLIFHDSETSPYPSGVHARYTDLCTLAPEIKAKMWLYHYNPGSLPDPLKDGFRGFIKKGQSFEFAEKK